MNLSQVLIFTLRLWALLACGVALVTMFMFPKRLLALTLFAALAVMPTCVLRAQWYLMCFTFAGSHPGTELIKQRLLYVINENS